MSKKDTTYIPVSRKTRELLGEVGKLSETYDTLIQRLLREAGYIDEEGNLVRRS